MHAVDILDLIIFFIGGSSDAAFRCQYCSNNRPLNLVSSSFSIGSQRCRRQLVGYCDEVVSIVNVHAVAAAESWAAAQYFVYICIGVGLVLFVLLHWIAAHRQRKQTCHLSTKCSAGIRPIE